jgi:hypothetical protein
MNFGNQEPQFGLDFHQWRKLNGSGKKRTNVNFRQRNDGLRPKTIGVRTCNNELVLPSNETEMGKFEHWPE